MCRWQSAESGGELPNTALGIADANAPTEFLHHIDAGASVRRIHHEEHRAVRLEHVSQSPKSSDRVGEVMQYPRAHDVIEARLQFSCSLDRQQVKLEISELVSPLELFRA